MTKWQPEVAYSEEVLRREGSELLNSLTPAKSLEEARRCLFDWLNDQDFKEDDWTASLLSGQKIRRQDCIRSFRSVIRKESDRLTGHSVTQALWDLSRGEPRTDLQSGFYAEIIHLILGIEGRADYCPPDDSKLSAGLSGRGSALARSDELDRIWTGAMAKMAKIAHGLTDEARARRQDRKRHILKVLGGSEQDWHNWKWQVAQVLTKSEKIARVVHLSKQEEDALARANRNHLPVGVTPYYASLMDEESSDRDRAVRAQVFPPRNYVDQMEMHRGDRDHAFDFMGEYDTSPVDLITRRYPAILILKPYNTCPQICVYCQRNWEIDQAMAPGAMASAQKIDEAIAWIEQHPAIREVLVTGGDPLTMSNDRLERILSRLAAIDHIDLIRVGSRIPVTVPMRITEDLATLLGSYRKPGRRELCLITHVEHPYEITDDVVAAVDRLRQQGIGVFNQLVYTFYVSRLFEAARLRMLLRRAGIDPYYTFVTKGKEETGDYRVPLSRLLQEQKEEARILPGIRRTDEVVYNVPRLGKNNVRAFQNRTLLGFEPGGARIYEFHPWEKNIVQKDNYVGTDVSILAYLDRLAAIGEDPQEYQSIWYYY